MIPEDIAGEAAWEDGESKGALCDGNESENSSGRLWEL